jgi:hypothetical protein
MASGKPAHWRPLHDCSQETNVFKGVDYLAVSQQTVGCWEIFVKTIHGSHEVRVVLVISSEDNTANCLSNYYFDF